MVELTMKIHKYVVYARDHEDYGPEEYSILIENIDFLKSFYIDSVEIGEWFNEIDINRSNSTQETFDKYFETK